MRTQAYKATAAVSWYGCGVGEPALRRSLT